jgi:hypothetical protein
VLRLSIPADQVRWDTARAEFAVDGRPVRSCLEPPTYPMQAMIAVFDFPEWSHGDDGALVHALEVDWIGGTDQATP